MEYFGVMLAQLLFLSRFILCTTIPSYYCDPNNECSCAVPQIQAYQSKISGPLIDRIDIHIEVPAVKYRDLASRKAGDPSREIKRRVDGARKVQLNRFKGMRIY